MALFTSVDPLDEGDVVLNADDPHFRIPFVGVLDDRLAFQRFPEALRRIRVRIRYWERRWHRLLAEVRAIRTQFIVRYTRAGREVVPRPVPPAIVTGKR